MTHWAIRVGHNMVDILFEGIVVLIDCQAISFLSQNQIFKEWSASRRVSMRLSAGWRKTVSQRRCVPNQEDPKEDKLLLIFAETENRKRLILSRLICRPIYL